MISIVDDDESFRVATTKLLKSLGYRALPFASAEDFLQSGHLDDTSCLILDVNMPGLGGMALQGHLNARGSSTPVIFVTARPEAALRQQAIAAGAVGFLSKPFRQEALIEYLERALNRRK